MDDVLKDHHPVDPPEHPAPAEAISTGAKLETSRLERLRERRRAAREDRDPLDLPIPGYGDELIARYRVLDYDELQKLQKRGGEMARSGDKEAGLKVTIDTIAQACVGIFLAEEDGSLRPLNEVDPSYGDEPVRYDERLAEVVGIDAEGKVRILIRRAFPSDLSIIAHLERIDSWMSSTNDADDAGF
jgi:hypothetical protein